MTQYKTIQYNGMDYTVKIFNARPQKMTGTQFIYTSRNQDRKTNGRQANDNKPKLKLTKI